MSPRKTTPAKKKKSVESAGSFSRGVLERTSHSVASIKEKTKQGLKRLASKGALGRKTAQKSSTGAGGSSNENGNATLGAKPKRNNNSNQSPAVKVFRPRSDENTPQRHQPPRKVKTCKGPKQRHGSELEKRRVPVSMSSALQEMKGNISKAVETVSTKLRINRVGLAGGRRSVRQSAYDPLLSAETPVKLYSPFAIGEFEHTPAGGSALERSAGRSGRPRAASSSTQATPKNREKGQGLKQRTSNVSRNLLDTPTGKFRQDLEDMTKGFEELTSLTKGLRNRTQQEKIWG